MKRFSLFLAAAVCLRSACLGEDNAARAAAEREAAEERYRLMNSAVDALTTGQADLQHRLSALAEEVRSLRQENSRIDTSKFVTREEFNRLVKAIDEIEQKRAADKKLIREEFEQLKKDIVKLLNAPAPSAPPKKNKTQSPPDKGSEKPTERSSEKGEKTGNPAPEFQEYVKHTVEDRDTLSAIVRAYNEKFKEQGKKTSVNLVLQANRGLDEKKLRIGQTIIVPLVAE